MIVRYVKACGAISRMRRLDSYGTYSHERALRVPRAVREALASVDTRGLGSTEVLYDTKTRAVQRLSFWEQVTQW